MMCLNKKCNALSAQLSETNKKLNKAVTAYNVMFIVSIFIILGAFIAFMSAVIGSLRTGAGYVNPELLAILGKHYTATTNAALASIAGSLAILVSVFIIVKKNHKKAITLKAMLEKETRIMLQKIIAYTCYHQDLDELAEKVKDEALRCDYFDKSDSYDLLLTLGVIGEARRMKDDGPKGVSHLQLHKLDDLVMTALYESSHFSTFTETIMNCIDEKHYEMLEDNPIQDIPDAEGKTPWVYYVFPA